jgi:hypothetical protein
MKGIVNLQFTKTEQVMAPHKTTFPVGEKEYNSFKRKGGKFERRDRDDSIFIAKAFIYAVDNQDFDTVNQLLDVLARYPGMVGANMPRFYNNVAAIFEHRIGRPSGTYRNQEATRQIIEEFAKS